MAEVQTDPGVAFALANQIFTDRGRETWIEQQCIKCIGYSPCDSIGKPRCPEFWPKEEIDDYPRECQGCGKLQEQHIEVDVYLGGVFDGYGCGLGPGEKCPKGGAVDGRRTQTLPIAETGPHGTGRQGNGSL